MRTKLMTRYDQVFSPFWIAPLSSRKELLSWVCEQRNAFYTEREKEDQHKDCSAYTGLLREFGPDYEPLKRKLGFVRGLFD